MALVQVKDLKVHFPVDQGFFRKARQSVRAVDGVGFEIAAGETLGLVGESGCGKTTLGRAVIRLIQPTSGTIEIDGRNIAPLSDAELRPMRRSFQMIFQDPYGSLNPRMSVGSIIGEALDIHRITATPALRRERTDALLKDVGLDPSHRDKYPHEFSGGQRQRIGIARALAVQPRLIVCDEPVSALDVSVQAQVVNLLSDLQVRRGIAYLFIAHDLAVVEHISHRILVMYLGKAVEMGTSREVCGNARHPYTRALISAVPRMDGRWRARTVLRGEVPSPVNPPSGCPFHPRCPLAVDRCRTEIPALREILTGHFAACHLA